MNRDRRVYLTEKEVELIERMIFIAQASELGEGDYAEWKEDSRKTLEKLARKLP